MAVRSLFATLAALSTLTIAAPQQHAEVIEVRAENDVDLFPTIDTDYAPKPVGCPSSALVRPAQGLNANEAQYFKNRKAKADKALAAWLKLKGKFSTKSQPSVAFTSSGGGYRAFLEAAGVVQALDARDGNFTTSGIFQGLTYEAGLSGGAWFLSSFSGNNWPTVSSLRDGLWEEAFQAGLLLPANILASDEYPEIIVDVVAKDAAGFDNTIVDPYGRLLSYQFLYGEDGGDDIRMSTLTTFSNFTSYNVPYPVITALGVDNSYDGQCYPTLNATQYEFGPYEYGSWDQGVSAFASTKYMGSDLTNGKPTKAGQCIEHYDNIGYVFGTSSDIFPGICQVVTPVNSSNTDLSNFLQDIISVSQPASFQDLFGIYPNPFKGYARSTAVKDDKLITMADGGLAGQNVPIWPFIQPARTIDVLIASDNSADTSDNFPNGTEIRQTYINAQAAGLTKMPYIPDVAEFVSKGLNKRATFFGCDEPNTTFIIYLPNVAYKFPSNQPTSKVQYSVAETNGMIENGNAIATQNGDEGWGFCFACGIKARDGKAKLPQGCNACFTKYCYRR
ncbi:Putative lysophospholipase, catalytic domain, Acyl transferase/acyl hydrolase/lysophospholipase [Septoria linicola]|uniref:Lysophospholipase n=1 Tax=Septoria linicola TaxID=215465 RepID=A0A9Q9ASZ2_9PEZI|nr:putative lysophospholipase, catalytic domain, Acyl transferase/acyl hydrolase/lysophospholipase [Septoria linicola]USW51985.1 Putative lysophospholipase, catalytic domain, Acyl transferase/acyl hydrolase/lysophospholipase [Septoria linicola]